VKKMKIGQYLAKIWTKVCGLLFGPLCTYVLRGYLLIYINTIGPENF